ncbi:MAG: HAD family hydrolase [Porticoccaceae bacterium]
MNTPQAVFFDLDETLIKNTSDTDALFGEVFRSQFVTLDPILFEPFMAALREHAAHVWDTMFDRAEPATDQLTQAMASAIAAVGGDTEGGAAFFEAFTAAAAANSELHRNARETLEALRGRGIGVGIITNGFEALQMTKIRRHGLHDLVDAIIVSEHAGAHKPSPLVFEFALRKLGVAARSAWHVGDHPVNDVAGAAGVGLGAIYFNPALADGELDGLFPQGEKPPLHAIADLAELQALIA